MRRFVFVCLTTSCIAINGPASAEDKDILSDESGYLSDLPVVLSVTRLAQSLADTPGAVTIIDREMIRRLGVREIAEVLKLVPGFLVSYVNASGAYPSANYHGYTDDYSRRMQVFIDGRSVYSSLFIGDTHRGLMGIVLEDVERIEVLRGSNSAAYGANAFLGVVNIITRNAADTHGGVATITKGDQGIFDNAVRYGWGSDDASFRITASRKSDTGLNAFWTNNNSNQMMYDDKQVSELSFRGDISLANGDDVMIQAGSGTNSSGIGTGATCTGASCNPFRNEQTFSTYLQGHWTHLLGNSESLTVSATYDDERYYEDFIYTPLLPTSVRVGYSGQSQRYNLEVSHTRQSSDSLRTVWGVNWRREDVESKFLFASNPGQSQQQLRLFGNAEWRFSPDWVMNAGALYEHNSIVEDNLAPRLMLNYHLSNEHTFRVGITKAQRSPTLFELRADQSYYNPTTGALLARPYYASGHVVPEKIVAREVGYLGEMRDWHLSVDVRAYSESVSRLITPQAISANTNDFANTTSFVNHGLEQQWTWKPNSDSQFILSHAYQILISDDQTQRWRAPRSIYSGAWLQKLPDNFDLGLLYYHVSEMSYAGVDRVLPGYSQIDLRLARSFRIAGTRAEVALTTQGINGTHLEYKQNAQVSRRAFATLRLEF